MARSFFQRNPVAANCLMSRGLQRIFFGQNIDVFRFREWRQGDSA